MHEWKPKVYLLGEARLLGTFKRHAQSRNFHPTPKNNCTIHLWISSLQRHLSKMRKKEFLSFWSPSEWRDRNLHKAASSATRIFSENAILPWLFCWDFIGSHFWVEGHVKELLEAHFHWIKTATSYLDKRRSACVHLARHAAFFSLFIHWCLAKSFAFAALSKFWKAQPLSFSPPLKS